MTDCRDYIPAALYMSGNIQQCMKNNRGYMRYVSKGKTGSTGHASKRKTSQRDMIQKGVFYIKIRSIGAFKTYFCTV